MIKNASKPGYAVVQSRLSGAKRASGIGSFYGSRLSLGGTA
jgi:hypothetical protein